MVAAEITALSAHLKLFCYLQSLGQILSMSFMPSKLFASGSFSFLVKVSDYLQQAILVLERSKKCSVQKTVMICTSKQL